MDIATENNRTALSKCFHSENTIWDRFINTKDNLNIGYYPSVGRDFRPLLYTCKEGLEHIGAEDALSLPEPDLYLFSDYLSDTFLKIKPGNILYEDERTKIKVKQAFNLETNKQHVTYYINKRYIHFTPPAFSGQVVFALVEVESKTLQYKKTVPIIYFAWENVTVFDQIIVRHNIQLSDIVWLRDGTGFGGGSIFHSYLFRWVNSSRVWIWQLYERKMLSPVGTLISESELPELGKKHQIDNHSSPYRYPRELKDLLKTKPTLQYTPVQSIIWCGDTMRLLVPEVRDTVE